MFPLIGSPLRIYNTWLYIMYYVLAMCLGDIPYVYTIVDSDAIADSVWSVHPYCIVLFQLVCACTREGSLDLDILSQCPLVSNFLSSTSIGCHFHNWILVFIIPICFRFYGFWKMLLHIEMV